MPAAPKKNKRRDADFYETPTWCTEALFTHLDIPRDAVVVEPCAGFGAISSVIKEHNPDCKLIQQELIQFRQRNVGLGRWIPIENTKLQQYGDVTFGDFLLDLNVDTTVEYVITNPPFSLAQEFVFTCRKKYPNAEIIMLLPFSFLGSAKRYRWWTQNPPNKFSILSDRPSFTNDGKTDSSVYAWYHWFDNANRELFHAPEFLKKGDEWK
jgi:hypothetical protein